MTRTRLLIFASILLWTSLAAPHIAFACSGGDQILSLNSMLEDSRFFVRATVVEVDDLAKNGILRVHEYLTGGGGPQYLLVQTTDPELMAAHYRHGFDTGCLYGGSGSMSDGMSGYFALNPRGDGSYWPPGDDGYFIPVEGEVYLRTDPGGGDGEDNVSRAYATSAEIHEWVAEISGETPASPTGGEMPWIAPLSITTSTGASYKLPIDGGSPVKIQRPQMTSNWPPDVYPLIYEDPPVCDAIGCNISAPDGALMAGITADSTILVDYVYSEFGVPGDDPEWTPLAISGEAFGMSPPGDSLLMWYEGALTVYRITNAACVCMYASIRPAIEEIVSVGLNSPLDEPAAIIGSARWSRDGSTLTYADNDGLWLIDVARGNMPELLVPTRDGLVPAPLHVSQRGRYVSYRPDSESRNWTTLDRVTGATMPNRLPAPGETVFAFFVDEDTDSYSMFMAADLCVGGCSIVTRSGLPFVWYANRNEDWYWLFDCGHNSQPANGCAADSDMFTGSLLTQSEYRPNTLRFSAVLDLDYEPRRNMLAVVEAPQRVQVGDTEFDLSGIIEGDIVDIRWYRPLFFYWDQ